MKIAYVVPGPMSVGFDEGKDELERRGALLKQWAAKDTVIDIVDTDEGPASIESAFEEYLSIPSTVAKMIELEGKGYDAAILGCAGDPGLDAMREVTTNMLVVGPAESSYLTAAMLGHRFSIITIASSMIADSIEKVDKVGVGKKLASVRAINIPVLELANDHNETVTRVADLGIKAVEQDRTDVLVLGCMSLGFLDIADELTAKIGVPVINPSKVALKTAEALVGARLCHSKKAFMLPAKLVSGKVTNVEQLMVRKTK